MTGRLAPAATLALLLVLTVVFTSAAIRLGSNAQWIVDFPVGLLRPVHRVSATLEVIVALWLAWKAWHLGAGVRRAALIALALTVLLSAVGIAAGRNPSPGAAAVNLLGGLALTATFAWILGALDRRAVAVVPALALAGLLVIQVALGAWLSLVGRWSAALPAHGVLALVLAAALVRAGLGRLRGAPGGWLAAAACAAPLAGFTSLHYDYSAFAAWAHAAAAAALVGITAYALARGA